jgi:hypothetical protein
MNRVPLLEGIMIEFKMWQVEQCYYEENHCEENLFVVKLLNGAGIEKWRTKGTFISVTYASSLPLWYLSQKQYHNYFLLKNYIIRMNSVNTW